MKIKSGLEKLFLLVILVLNLFFNILYLDKVPAGLHGDEAEHALQAQKILQQKLKFIGVGWYDLPLPSFWLNAAGIKIFGPTIFGARIGSAIIGATTLLPFFGLVKLLWGKRVAFMTTIFLVTSHWWIAFSRLGINYNQAAFVGILFFFLFFKTLSKRNKIYGFLSGLTLGLIFYQYYAARIIPIIFLGLGSQILVKNRQHITSLITPFVLLLLGFSLISFPMIRFYYQHPHTFSSRTNSVYIFSPNMEKWLKETYGQASKIEILLLQAKKSFSLSSNWQDTSGQYGYQGRILEPVTLVLFFVGITNILLNLSKIQNIFLLLWLSLTLFFGWILTETPPFVPRVVVAIPAVFIIVGLGLESFARWLDEKFKLRKATYLVLALILIIISTHNLLIYFRTNPAKELGDPNKYTATKVAKYLNSLGPKHKVIFLTAPYFYHDFAPIKFLAPNATKVGIYQVLDFQPKREKDTVYVVHPAYRDILEKVIKVNPSGTIENEREKKGQIQVWYYRID